jgi:hypothetical protein
MFPRRQRRGSIEGLQLASFIETTTTGRLLRCSAPEGGLRSGQKTSPRLNTARRLLWAGAGVAGLPARRPRAQDRGQRGSSGLRRVCRDGLEHGPPSLLAQPAVDGVSGHGGGRALRAHRDLLWPPIQSLGERQVEVPHSRPGHATNWQEPVAMTTTGCATTASGYRSGSGPCDPRSASGIPPVPAATSPAASSRRALRAADTRELLGWILSFGGGGRVLRPAQLRNRVRAGALRVAHRRPCLDGTALRVQGDGFDPRQVGDPASRCAGRGRVSGRARATPRARRARPGRRLTRSARPGCRSRAGRPATRRAPPR